MRPKKVYRLEVRGVAHWVHIPKKRQFARLDEARNTAVMVCNAITRGVAHPPAWAKPDEVDALKSATVFLIESDCDWREVPL